MAGPWIIGKYAYSALVRDDMTADELKKVNMRLLNSSRISQKIRTNIPKRQWLLQMPQAEKLYSE